MDRLSHDGAKVIGFDIGFLEPDENSQALINQLSQQSSLGSHRTATSQEGNNMPTTIWPWQCHKKSSAPSFGLFFSYERNRPRLPARTAEIDQQLKRISTSKYPFIMLPHMGLVPFSRAYAPESNLDILTEAAASSGYFSLRSDRDGVVRWMPLMIQGGEDLFPPLAVLCAWHYLGKPQLTVQVGRYGVEGYRWAVGSSPPMKAGNCSLTTLAHRKPSPMFSISDVLSGKLPRGTFTDKIVLVGATAMGTHDLRNTPFSPLYPGVEIHATVIDNILTQNFLTKPKWSKIYDLLAIIILGVLIGIALPRIVRSKGCCSPTGLCMLHIVIARWLFVHAGVWLNLVYPLLALSTNYLGLSFNSIAQQLRQAFRELQSELEERQRAEKALRRVKPTTGASWRDTPGHCDRQEGRDACLCQLYSARMLGYEGPEELIGRSIGEHTPLHELLRFQAAVEADLQGEPVPLHDEYQAVKKDGTLIWVERLASPMTLNGSSDPGGHIDITERKRLETQLRQAHKMQAIGTLAGGIAHDFNNILTAILGYADWPWRSGGSTEC